MVDWIISLFVDPTFSEAQVIQARIEALKGFFSLFGASVPLLLGVAGWLGTRVWSLFQEHRLRRRRTRDILLALHAEIDAGGYASGLQSAAAEQDYAIRNTSPFGVADRTDFVFALVKPDLAILPEEVVHQVVRYYRLGEQSNLLTDGLAHPHFARQKRKEREKYIRGLLSIVDEQGVAASSALGAIEDYARRRYGADLGGRRRELAAEREKALAKAVRPVDGSART